MALFGSIMRFLLIVTTFLFLTAEAPSPWAMEELAGNRAPDFTLKDLSGSSVSLSSFRGKVVLINFWASWCPPCREEMPSLDRLYNAYKSKGLVVLAVATDKRISDVKSYMSKYPRDFLVLPDPDLKISRLYKVFSMPTTFLIAKDGGVIKRYLGEEEWDSPEIRKEIEKALAGK